MDRRTLLALALGAASGGCGSIGVGTEAAGAPAAAGRLEARPPRTPPGGTRAKGSQPLGLGSGRDGILYVPEGLTGPAAFLLLLHGATGSAAGITGRLAAFAHADELKMVVLAPDSRLQTWDVIRGGFGPDAAFVDKALARVFATVAIDPTRVAVGGFSDGATYALSLGLVNGDLFTHVAAFSPGFFVAGERHGSARFFVSHGQQDEILPIDSTSRRVVPALQRAGYDVRYREFNGPHTVPAAIAREAFAWIVGERARQGAR
jgi:phospholipase/carboxylesterase